MESLPSVCKKCLIYEMAEKEQYQSMYTYISQLDEEIKAEDALYQQRLAECKHCESLFNGLCRICGCFVEMRAAVKKNSCPSSKAKW